MKKKLTLLPVLGILMYVLLSSYSSGPGLSGYERTGAGATVGCGTGCHATLATTTTVVVVQLVDASTLTPVTAYVAGRAYNIKISGTQTSGSLTLPKFGFQVSAVLTSNHTLNEGTLTATAGTHIATPGGIKVAEHSSALTSPTYVTGAGGAGTTYNVTESWTAPVAGTGGVSFFSVLNACNTVAGDDAGDKWNNTSLAVTELSSISGASTVCVGGNITLTDVTAGGTWSGGSGFATVGSTGIISGTSAGVATVSYTFGGSSVTKIVTVSTTPAAPAAISGTRIVCAGATTSLSDATGGGVWSSTAPGVGSVSTSGLVTGLSSGTTTISYTETNSCGSNAATVIVTVNPLPLAPGAITGTATVCAGGATTALTDATAGGVWSSTVPGNASAGSTGVVTGLVAGTTTISYTETNSCGSLAATKVVTVNPLPAAPAAISGTATVCEGGATTTLSDATGGGTWTSTIPGNASVSSTGVVTGLSAGTTTISYTETTSCSSVASTLDVTVNPLPAVPTAISGTATVCAGGATTTLSDATGGGGWSSTVPGNASVGSTGIVTGLVAGTTTISYTETNGCGNVAAVVVVTINPLPVTPAPISGAGTVCEGGATVTLSDATGGGTWSSTIPGNASVGSTGIVTGISAGTTTISYTETTVCGSLAATRVITVNPLPATPAAISGTGAICAGGPTLSLTDVTAGGTWSSVSPGVATVSTAGVVTGVSGGTATISYTLSNSCGSLAATTVVTINSLPATPGSINGTTTICAGGPTVTLSDATVGGIWSSTLPGNASIGSTGVVTGLIAGTTMISYTVTNGCGNTAATVVVTVNTAPATPAAISGTATVCQGSVTSLSDATGGGTWSSVTPGVATAGSTGIITGVSGGTSTISYTVSNGCGSVAAAIDVTVNPLPATPGAINGTTTFCSGGPTVSLSDITGGGVWSSVSPGIASISSTGIVTGLSGGTATISYTVTNGCGSAAATVVITVNSLPAAPAAISGIATVCEGSVTSLSDATAGGTWSSTIPGTASIGSTGVVGGVIAGTATISYTATNGCGSTAATIDVTVNPLPVAPATINGTAVVCAGAVTSLSDATGGGAWSSTAAGIATVGSAGDVTGISGGTATISYTVTNSCGSATATIVVTVNPLPSAGTITGPGTVCTGANISLTDATTGGTWFSTNTNASVAGTGVVTGNIAGTDTIVYTVSNGCGADTAAKIITVTTTAAADPISGPLLICLGDAPTMTDDIAGGVWSSSSTVVATIGSASGTITTMTAGTTTITYAVTTTCGTASTTLVVTVTPLPTPPAAISGTATVCEGGATTSLSDVTAGGVWSSASPGTASVGSTGTVTGVSAGTATISYATTSSCGSAAATVIVTVNPLPSAPVPITGPGTVCEGGGVMILSDISGGGSWSSVSTANATVGSATGIVTGVSAGTTMISYTKTNGCGSVAATAIITINPLPTAVLGAASVCAGLTTTLSDATVSGTWSSASTGIATVGTTGIVSGVVAGTSSIAYTVGTGCFATVVVTVNIQPGAILGSASLCPSTTTILSDSPSSGIWSSSTPTVATIGSVTGIVSGISAGTTVISCTLPDGCFSILMETVNLLPATIDGAAQVCTGSITTLSDATGGGTWASGASGTATVGSTGNVSGIIAGTARITYTALTGCIATVIVTVNPLPGTILGATQLCTGATTILTDVPSSGTWSSNTTSVATIGSVTGILSGISAGTAVISCTVPTGCFVTRTETVNPLPAVITGTASVCEGATTTVSDASAGGTWTGSTVVATVGSTGIVTGLVAGTANITYTLPTGCAITGIVTVNIQPGAVLGATSLCESANTTLSDTPLGGTWSSSNTAIATAGSGTGVISGASSGTTVITYSLSTGCLSTITETINATPSAITGTASLCEGSTTTLSDASVGGSWTSGSGVAAIGSAGDVTGLSAGTTAITYAFGTGCAATTTATVNPQPAAISGTGTVCETTNTLLSDTPGGGMWSSAYTGVATIGSASGLLSGINAGTTIVSYILPAGCFSTMIATVNPQPAAITGGMIVCAASITNLTDTSAGGTWSSGTPGIATTGSTGDVLGVAAGTANITYTVSTGCSAVTTVTVNPLPGIIIGASSMCAGSTIVVSAIPAVGVWSSSDTTIATIDSFSGVVSGLAEGTAVISCTLPTGCATTLTETVNPSPAAIGGAAEICTGSITTLNDSIPGGTWNSGSVTIATISSTGVVFGLAAGTSRITYALAGGCESIVVVTIDPLPGAISGATHFCAGGTSIVSVTPAVGTWSSGDTSIATIGAFTGIVSGISGGVAVISCTLATGCFTTAIETVDPLPAAISGTPQVCVGITTQLTDADADGTWSSNNTSVAIIDSATGLVSGIAEGNATITYTLPTGCRTTIIVNDTCNVGIKPIEARDNFISIFPNPNNGAFFIQGSFGVNGDEVFIEVRETTGRIVYVNNLITKNGLIDQEIQLDNTLANGIYFVTLHSGDQSSVYRITIIK